MTLYAGLSSRLAKFLEWTMFLLLSGSGVAGLIVAASSPGSGTSRETIITVLLSLLSLAIGLERVVLILRFAGSAEASYVHLEEILKGIDSKLSGQSIKIDDLVSEVGSLELAAQASVLANYRRHLSEYLAEVFGSLWEKRIATLREAIEEGEVILDRRQDFRDFYLRTLNHFRSQGTPVEFVATSLPSVKYFWDDEALKAVAQFVDSSERRMRRIFIVSEKDLDDEEVKDVMRKQSASNVRVFTAWNTTVKKELTHRFIMVETTRSIAWEVFAREGEPTEIESVKVTTNSNRIDYLWQEIDAIAASPFEPKEPN